MSYFIYVPATNLSSNFVPEDYQTYCNQANNNNLYSNQKFFLTPTFNSSQFPYSEYPCYPTQQDYVIPTYASLPQIQPEVQEVKEPKKRQRNSQKQIQSAKKNSESNLINHFFSFFNSRQKSQKTVEASINSLSSQQSHKEKLLHLFYNTIHVVNARRGRKYVNRKILISLFEPDQLLKTVPEIKERISKINQITLQELCQVFRKCCYSFYRTYSIDSILTSKRISCIAKQEHFRKRRKVIKAFREKQ